MVVFSFSTWRHPSVLHGAHHVYQSTRAFPPPKVPSAAAAQFPRHPKMKKSPFPRWCRRHPVLEILRKSKWNLGICLLFFAEGSKLWVCFLMFFDASFLFEGFFGWNQFFFGDEGSKGCFLIFCFEGWRTRVFGIFFRDGQKKWILQIGWLVGVFGVSWSVPPFFHKGSFSRIASQRTHLSHPRVGKMSFRIFLFGGICMHIYQSNQQPTGLLSWESQPDPSICDCSWVEGRRVDPMAGYVIVPCLEGHPRTCKYLGAIPTPHDVQGISIGHEWKVFTTPGLDYLLSP